MQQMTINGFDKKTQKKYCGRQNKVQDIKC